MMKIPIKLIEDHDQAYYIWKKMGLSQKTLIHFDAHVDFKFLPLKSPEKTIEEAQSKKELVRQLYINRMYKEKKVSEKSVTNIGNYIYPAIRDGIVSDFYWVVPGKKNEFRRSLESIRTLVKSFFTRDPFKTGVVSEEEEILRTKIYGRNFIVTTLDGLPENINEALLDIDTDYLTISSIRRAGAHRDVGKRIPWMWPEEFVERLKEKRIGADFITIAYSVNGGYTPLIYKFLGDEVAVFLNGVQKEFKETIKIKNNALKLFKEGKIEETISLLQKVISNLESIRINDDVKQRLKAHIDFVLFRCFAMLKSFDKAKYYYNNACLSDKTYRVKDNNYGPLFLKKKKRNLKKAEHEFNLILSIDNNNPYAISGMAQIFMRRRDFKTARILFKKAYEINRENREAFLGFINVALRLKNYEEVLNYLENYPFKNKIQGSLTSFLIQAYEGLGKYNEALKEYKIASRFVVNPDLYLKLFRLIRKTGIPGEHREWIKKRIDAYEHYRRGFFKSEKNKTKQQKQTDRIKRLIERIDSILVKIRKKDRL